MILSKYYNNSEIGPASPSIYIVDGDAGPKREKRWKFNNLTKSILKSKSLKKIEEKKLNFQFSM